MKDHRVKRILYSQEQIEAKCKELAQWINTEYKDAKGLIIVGLLKGSFQFIAELMKNITVDVKIDFMSVSSYAGTQSTGNIKIRLDLGEDIANKDVLVVEDIVDTGKTLSVVMKNLEARSPKSLKVMTLLDKPSGRKVEFEADKVGWVIENEFVVGFGFDVNNYLRNLPYIAVFDETYLDEINSK